MTREKRLGMGILAGGALVVLFVVGIVMAHNARSLHYIIEFENAEGVKKGDIVQMNGVAIGVVQSIELHAQPPHVDIHVKIDPEHAQKVRSDSTAVISSDSLVNVSGQQSIQVINPTTDTPAPPLTDGKRVIGMDNWAELKAWELKRKFANGADEVKGMLVLAQEGLKAAADQIEQITTSPQAKDAMSQLKAFAEKMKNEGQSAVKELAAEWPKVKAKVQPMLKELSDFGRTYIVDQIKQVMEQIEATLKRWSDKTEPGTPTEKAPAEAMPEVPSKAPGDAV